MVEDSDSPEEEEAGEKKENAPVHPPPPPPGMGTTLPPPGDFQPPPPPPGFPEPPKDAESISTEDSQTIDHEAARRMLLGLEEPNEAIDRGEVSEEETLQESIEPENSGDEVEEPPEENQPLPPPGFSEEPEGEEEETPPPPPMGFEAPPPPPGFSEEPEGEEEETPPIPDEMPVESDISSIDSLADSLSLLEDEWEPDSDVLPHDPFESNISSEQNQSPTGSTDQEISQSEVAQAIDSFELVSEPELNQPDETKMPRQSPFLRSASEVDSIPGDKLHATLSETEKSVLNPDGTIRKQFIDGELILRNSSKKHRAWDIEVHLESIDSTDFGDRVSSVKELDPTEETAIPYTASGPRMLVLKESIDTESSRDEEPSLSMVFSDSPQEIEINIEIENVSPAPLYDVEVKRTIPESFILPDDSVYSVEKDSVVWDIGRMNIGEKRNLAISARVNTESVEKINAGVTSATYSSESTVSRSRFDRVSGSGRQFSYVNAEEDDRPGVWHCTCVFENKSSFVVSLSGATVRLIGREDPILEVSDIRQDVPPEGKWDSMVKRVESDDQPSFTQEIRFSILPRVSVQSSGTVELKEQQLTVLDAALQKRFDKSRIKSYISSKVETVITLENTGTSEINVLRVLDDIPGIFDTPNTEDISIEIEGTELKQEQYRIDLVNGTQLEERHVSPDREGNALRMTIGTSAPLGLQPGKAVVIRYPLLAPDPSPRNELLVAPIKVDFSSERFGPVATRTVDKPPIISVVHKRRNISTGKEVFPGGKPGQYEIMLMFHNSSDSALDDLALHDIVPGTFSIEESVVRSDKDGERDSSITKESARDGTQVTWAIGRILQGERIEVLYTIQGDPEAEYKVSDAQDFHGATFGDEVDEEPNVPQWLEQQEEEMPSASKDAIEVEHQSEPVVEEEPENKEDEVESETEAEKHEESEESEDKSNTCPACGFEVGIGSSICVVCGHTLS